MILIIGLGNPGLKYKETKHNVGQQVLDGLQARWQSYGFSQWQEQKKFKALTSQGTIGQQKIVLVKPLTYMNNSGNSVSLLKNYYRSRSDNLWLIHDDIDLPLGTIRISQDRGTAGHKGVASIVAQIKTKNFVRFRLGVAPEKGKPKNTEVFVLKKFSRLETRKLGPVIKKIHQAIETAVTENLVQAMNRFN